MALAEFDLIELIRGIVNIDRSDVILGIGDDGAITRVPEGFDLVTVTDTMVVDVHFPHDASAFDIGWKSLAVNLSDLAAMGARPVWASLALTLPKAERIWCEAFANGFATLAKQYHIALIGGDTSRGPLTITVTVQGVVARGHAVKRRGAKIGDAIVITGPLGLAAAGLACWQNKATKQVHCARELAEPAWLQALHRPIPRLDLIRKLLPLAHAAIDISDGLLADLSHLAKASGLSCEVELERLPVDAKIQSLFGEKRTREMQLSGGDDYQLALAIPAAKLSQALSINGVQKIARCVAGEGVRVLSASGAEVFYPHRGYQHFGEHKK